MAHLAHLDHRLPEKIDGLEIHNIIRSWQDKMPSFNRFFKPGCLLRTILWIMNLIACVFCMVHINRFEELTWHGIWGFPHLVFGAVCGLAFTIGTNFDPRKPPSSDLLVMERTRYWGLLALVVSLVIVNIFPFGADNLPLGLGVVKILMTNVTIVTSGSLLMDLFVLETVPQNADAQVQDQNPPKSCLTVLLVYITASIMYIVMLIVNDNDKNYVNFSRGLLSIFTYSLVLFVLAAMAGFYREPVRRTQEMEGVVVQPPPQVAQELARNPYDGNDGNDGNYIYVV